MSNNVLVVDFQSRINCFSVHVSDSHIAMRCTTEFAGSIRILVQEGGDGFGGVTFQDKGNGWYQLTPRTTWGASGRRKADETLQSIFVWQAFASLKSLIERLDMPATFETRNENDHVLVHHRTLVVNTRPSSAGFKPNQPTTSSMNVLVRKFSSAGHRHDSR